MENSSPQSREKGKRSVSRLYRNLVSLIGALLAVVFLLCILFLGPFEVLSGHSNPYFGIFTFIVFPALMLFGVLLIPIGMLVERRRRRSRSPSEIPPFPRIDLNLPRHRRIFSITAVVGLVLLLASSFGSYQAYEYTDSTAFCGQLCHKVMNPEYTAYLNSPHARLSCVDCHVGPGATWYVKSKLSGLYQVYSAIFEKYPKPIHTPIQSLRPSPETCEQCHWPEKFFGSQLKVFTYYGSDEANTARQIRLMINTGGGSPNKGLITGIHWHMNIANEISYVSTDEQRQIIPWVQMKDKQGNVTEFFSQETPITPEEVAKATKRVMECVDCHNRPSHIFNPPQRSLNEAFLAGRLDPSLPYLKQQAVDLLSKEHATTPEALQAISTGLEAYYRENYATIFKSKEASIKSAVSEIQRIYSSNMFPEMKVDWRTHPDNIGHYYFPGCFRCHDGQHLSKQGKVIRNDCNICHTVQEQHEGQATIVPIKGQSFQHPIELPDMATVKCTDCHAAVNK